MIPKSLHTVTVLVNVAATMKGAPIQNLRDCTLSVMWAANVLGYDAHEADPYFLIDKAAAALLRKVLAKEVRS